MLGFTKDGKAVLTMNRNGKEFKGEGTYKLDGNKISLTMKLGDQEEMSVRTITKLTDTDMVTTGEMGKERVYSGQGQVTVPRGLPGCTPADC